MDVYVNDLASIKKLLTEISEEKSLKNYLEQFKCGMDSKFFDSVDTLKEYKLDPIEIKQKYFFKLNQSINQCLEKLNGLVDQIESHLLSMTRQNELEKDPKLIDSTRIINKKFWLNLYDLKSELKHENLMKTCSTHKFNEIVDKWLKIEYLHLQTEIEVCRCFMSK